MLIAKGYNGRSKGAKFVHKGILVVSDPITHVELYDTETDISYSSEYGIGPRRKHIGYSHPDRWPKEYQVKIPTTPEEYAHVLSRQDIWIDMRQAGLVGYDTKGAIGCGFFGNENPWNQFCSETIFDVLYEILDISHVLNHKMHPMKLIEVLKAVY